MLFKNVSRVLVIVWVLYVYSYTFWYLMSKITPYKINNLDNLSNDEHA